MLDKLRTLKKKITPPPETDRQTSIVRRFERKFFILPVKTGFAYSLLRQFCRPDREYPESTVHSLYFDTIDLDQYNRSASGEFSKTKVRIRWYDEQNISGDTVPVYIELKSREGFASTKQREKITVPAGSIVPESLSGGIIAKNLLNDTVSGFGFFHDSMLRPVIKISYRRYRFTELLTGTRVSLDYDIRSTMIAPDLGFSERELRLEGAVIEVKGLSVELPVTLRKMKLLDTDWSRFSKYSNSIDSHLLDPGSLARFSPSGKILEP